MRSENDTHSTLYSGLTRLHILYHACEGEIFGLWMIEELGRQGYKLSPGTLYPLRHSLEERRLLVSKQKLASGRYKLHHLFSELLAHGRRHQPREKG